MRGFFISKGVIVKRLIMSIDRSPTASKRSLVPETEAAPPSVPADEDHSGRWALALLVQVLAGGGSILAASWSVQAYLGREARTVCDAAAFLAAGLLSGLALLPVLRPQNPALSRPVRLATLLAAVAVSSGLVLRNGFQQFCGWDTGGLCELAYRLSLGQVSNVDFFFHMPYSFHLGAKMSVQLFGMWFGSFVLFCALVSAFSLIWTYALLRGLDCGPVRALWFGLAVQLMIVLGRSYFWYNPITSTAVILLFLSTNVAIRRPGSGLAWLSFAAAAMLVMMAKANAYAMLPGCLLALACCGRRPAILGIASLCIATVGIRFVGYVEHLPAWPTIQGGLEAARDRVHASLFVAPFFGDVPKVEIGLGYAEALACLATWGTALVGYVRAGWVAKEWRHVLVAEVLSNVACFATGFLFAQTNGELKCTDLVVAIVPTAVLVLFFEQSRSSGDSSARSRWHAASAVALVLLCSVCWNGAVGWGHVRRNVENGGWGLFYEPDVAVHPDAPPFFQGMAMGNNLHTVLADYRRFQEDSGREKKVWLGPRLAFLYPAFEVPPPRQFPMIWSPGDGYPLSQKSELLRNFESQDFDYLVFLVVGRTPEGTVVPDLTYIPPELLAIIEKNYRLDRQFASLAVLRKR